MAKKSRARGPGLIPGAWRALGAAMRWLWHHPQPAVFSAFLLLSAAALTQFARSSDAFAIAAIQTPPHVELSVPERLIGRNLWSVDLDALAADLGRQQPTLKRLRVTRELPNVLRIHAVRRVPLARVLVGRWYGIDAEGVLVPMDDGGERLVRLSGFEQALKTGQPNTDERLVVALRVLQRLRRHPSLTARTLTELNVADPAQIRFIVDDVTEIRCGSEENLEAQLARLRATMRVLAAQQVGAAYIDLRFAEPVVGEAT